MLKIAYLAAVGFEPTPPKRLVPKTSALDHSATLPSHFATLDSIVPSTVDNYAIGLDRHFRQDYVISHNNYVL